MLFKLTKAGAEFINNPAIKAGDFVLFHRTITGTNKDHMYRGHVEFLHWMMNNDGKPFTPAEKEGKPRELQVLDDEGNRYIFTAPIYDYRRMALVYNAEHIAFRVPLLPQHVEACVGQQKPTYVLPRIVLGLSRPNDPGIKYPAQYIPDVIKNTNAIEVKRFGDKVNGGNVAFLADLESKNPELHFPKEQKAIAVEVLTKLYQYTYTAKEEAAAE